MASSSRAIVVGGGLAGLSAASAVLESGGSVLLLDKAAFCGGSSAKAAGGINAAGTQAQEHAGVQDTVDAFASDTLLGGAESAPFAEVLCGNAGSGIRWLRETFDVDLSVVSQLGGHSKPRTHRGKGKPPGMAVTSAMLSMVERISEKTGRAQIVTNAFATELLTDSAGACTGLAYEKDGAILREHGPVILATGGYGADFAPQSLLARHRPDLLHLPTTNGKGCTGDGIRLGEAAGARTVHLDRVQVHPTGFVKPDDPEAKVKFLASEVLRSVGGLLLDGNGDRFVNELGRHNHITGEMWKRRPPFTLVLNKAAADEAKEECKFYVGCGLMRGFETGEGLARHLGVPLSKLEAMHEAHYQASTKTESNPDEGPWPAFPSGRSWDEASGKPGAGKRFFRNAISGSAVRTEPFLAATVTPVVHYCAGGLEIGPDGGVVGSDGKAIPGLYAAGEVAGGVHGVNRLAGSSLLDCLVFGRVAGQSCTSYMLGDLTRQVSLKELSEGILPGEGAEASGPPLAALAGTAPPQRSGQTASVGASASTSAVRQQRSFTAAEVSRHKTRGDCWVILHGRVLDLSSFLSQHPGGELAILTFAGRDATAEFDMIHPPGVIDKYAPDAVVGVVSVAADEKGSGATHARQQSVPVSMPTRPARAQSAHLSTARAAWHAFLWHLERMDSCTWCILTLTVFAALVLIAGR
uniref:Cytochrome b5 heme-binding domain-containing protein n=1 Tax=Alexandrium monilatum TaxID=311494 RepID=A0A7S4WIP6_9DINO